MSQLMYTRKGAVRLPDDHFAKGGEGAVYSVERNPGIVAKIYHPQERTPMRERKILAMLANPPRAGASVAWPLEALYTDRFCRNFAGFLMPRVKNSVKISELYDPATRSRHSWAFYIRVAQNLCAALEAVHRCGHICGDLNPANIFVDEKTALVTLVDTDSFHVRQQNGTVYPCYVFMGPYVPPEIHRLTAGGRSLRDIRGTTFTVWTDRFALACHIFSLLMNGCHPYACSVQGGISASRFNPEHNISDGRFPFSCKDPRISIPLYAPDFDCLTDELQKLSERTFCTGQHRPDERPSPDEWHRALESLAGSLKRCRKNHQHRPGIRKCPFCALEKRLSGLTPAKTGGSSSSAVKTNRANPAGGTPIKRPLTAKAAFGQAFGFILMLTFWSLLEYEMLRGLYLAATVWEMEAAALVALAFVPWVPFWLVKLWGPGHTPFWQGVRRVCRMSVLLAVGLCCLLGYLDVTTDGGTLIIACILYCIPPCILAASVPRITYQTI